MIFFIKPKERKTWEAIFDVVSFGFESFLERESASLWNNGRSDRRRSSGQEGKMFYAGQATRGLRDREFLQTPRGRIFSLLGFYSNFKYFTNVSVGLRP